MRRKGTPAWMQVVERRLEQAAEDARSRDGQDVLYAAKRRGPQPRWTECPGPATGHAYRTRVAERRLEQARSRPDAALPPASLQARTCKV